MDEERLLNCCFSSCWPKEYNNGPLTNKLKSCHYFKEGLYTCMYVYMFYILEGGIFVASARPLVFN